MMWNRMFGPMGWAYWMLIPDQHRDSADYAVVAQAARRTWRYLFILSLIVNTGMWFERFVIVVTSLYRDYLPSSWGTYRATKWDYMHVHRHAGTVYVPVLPVRALPAHDSDVGDPDDAAADQGERGGRKLNVMRQVTDAAARRNLRPAGGVQYSAASWCMRPQRRAYDAGYRRMECYTPYPVEEAAEASLPQEPRAAGLPGGRPDGPDRRCS